MEKTSDNITNFFVDNMMIFIFVATLSIIALLSTGPKPKEIKLVVWKTPKTSTLEIAPCDSSFEIRKAQLRATLAKITIKEKRGKITMIPPAGGYVVLTTNYDTNNFLTPGTFLVDENGSMYLMIGVDPFEEPGESNAIMPWFLYEERQGINLIFVHSNDNEGFQKSFKRVL